MDYDEARQIVKTFGSKVKELEWIAETALVNGSQIPVKASQLVKVLKELPRLEFLELNVDKFKVDECSKLKLYHLKKLSIDSSTPSSFHEFLTLVLPETTIIEHSFSRYGRSGVKKENSDKKTYQNFFSKQKSIQSLAIDVFESLEAIELLMLDEFKITTDEMYGLLPPEAPVDDPIDEAVADVLRKQPQLKAFDFSGFNMDKMIDPLCNLHQLESLSIDVFYSAPFGDKLNGLKNLKKFSIERCNDKKFLIHYLSEMRENLEEISVKFILISIPKMLENMPNLIKFNGWSTQRFNTFVKFMPKLETLCLKFHDNGLKLCDLDTGIVSENLKEVSIEFEFKTINDHIEEILEIFKICPNLEKVSINSKNHYEYWDKYRDMSNPGIEEWGSQSKDLVEKNFFERLSEKKSLKHLELNWIQLQNFGDFLPQIAENLNKLAKKHENVKILFQDLFHHNHPKKFSYQPLADAIKHSFDVKDYNGFNTRERCLDIASKKIEVNVDCEGLDRKRKRKLFGIF